MRPSRILRLVSVLWILVSRSEELDVDDVGRENGDVACVQVVAEVDNLDCMHVFIQCVVKESVYHKS